MSCVYSFDLIRIFDMQTTPNLVMLLKFVIFLSVGNPKSESNFFLSSEIRTCVSKLMKMPGVSSVSCLLFIK